MKKLKDMTEDERFSVWVDHMNGIKINKELQARGIGLDRQRKMCNGVR